MDQAASHSGDVSLDPTMPVISNLSNVESSLQQTAPLQQMGIQIEHSGMDKWKFVYWVVAFIRLFLGIYRDQLDSPDDVDFKSSDAHESALHQTDPPEQIDVQTKKIAMETLDSEKSDIESGPEQIASTEQIDIEMEEAAKQKWKFVNCALAFFGISLTLFGADFRSNSRGSSLVVEICLSSVSLISGVLFYIIYLKICKEKQLRLNRNPHNGRTKVSCHSNQFLLLSLSACLTFAVYILIGINAAKKL